MEINKNLFKLIELNKDVKNMPNRRIIGIKNSALYSITSYMASRITTPEQEEEGIKFFDPGMFIQSLKGIFAVRSSLDTNKEKFKNYEEASSPTTLVETVDSFFDTGHYFKGSSVSFDPVLLGQGIAAINSALAGVKRADKNVEIKYNKKGVALFKTENKAGLVIELLIAHKSY